MSLNTVAHDEGIPLEGLTPVAWRRILDSSPLPSTTPLSQNFLCMARCGSEAQQTCGSGANLFTAPSSDAPDLVL